MFIATSINLFTVAAFCHYADIGSIRAVSLTTMIQYFLVMFSLVYIGKFLKNTLTGQQTHKWIHSITFDENKRHFRMFYSPYWGSMYGGMTAMGLMWMQIIPPDLFLETWICVFPISLWASIVFHRGLDARKELADAES